MDLANGGAVKTMATRMTRIVRIFADTWHMAAHAGSEPYNAPTVSRFLFDLCGSLLLHPCQHRFGISNAHIKTQAAA
jgi:hypothetical protein